MNTTAKNSAYALVVSMAIICCAVSPTAARGETPLIQIALLLDTSNSMDGLIEQAKAQLWTVVNEFVTAKREGKRPEFQVALYEYGNSRLPEEESWVRQVLPLTTDLDKVSEELFAFKTSGGKEHCGTVIRRATDELAWSESPDDLKTIFIAGNEPFTQGKVNFRKACPEAITKGITVNTIFCGPYDRGIEIHWRDGAVLADGAYLNIDQDQEIVHIDAPQDEEIARLGTLLNSTYVPYGAEGRRGAANQTLQDVNAASMSGKSSVQRAITKSSGLYRNTGWDLVDAVEEGTVALKEVEDKGLPEEMRKMTVREREAFLKAKRTERKELQEKITALKEVRTKFVATERAKLSEEDKETLDTAVIRAAREQAVEKNYTFE